MLVRTLCVMVCALTSAAALSACGGAQIAKNRVEIADLRERLGKLQDQVEQISEALKAPAANKKSVKLNSVRVIGGKANGITISLSAEEIHVNGTPVSIETLRGFIDQAARQNASTQVLITANKQVPHSRVVNIMEELREAGMTKIKLVTR